MRRAPFQLRLEHAGSFLGYRGSPRPLPRGWDAWNAYQGDVLVGSLALACGRAGGFDWDEADYEGPFFSSGAAPALLRPASVVARLESVYIAPRLRGGELWRRYAAVLVALRMPVYAAFTNPRVREHFQLAHRPAPLAENRSQLWATGCR